MVKKWYQKLSIKLKSRFDLRYKKDGKNQIRPYIIPSRFGIYFGLGILVLLLLAFTYANQLIYLIAFFYASFLFIVMHLTNNNIKYLKIENYYIPAFFADQKGKIFITIKNEHLKFSSRFIELRLDDSKVKKEIKLIKPLESILVTIDFEEKQRGLFPYSSLKIATKFPFEIFFSWKKLNWKLNYFVYPTREGELALPSLPKDKSNEKAIENITSRSQNEGNFYMHKEYALSDNSKRIDWKVFARKNKLYVKVFDEDNTSITFIDIPEQLTKLTAVNFEKKIYQLTKWINTAQKTNIPCIVRSNLNTIQLLETPKDFENIYEYLALAKYTEADTHV